MLISSRLRFVAIILAPLFLTLSLRAQVPDRAIEYAQATQSSPQTIMLKDCNKSRMLGRQDASLQHSASGWFLGGVGSGLLLGIVGTGVITIAAATSNPQPLDIPDDVTVNCYRDGYRSRCRGENAGSAFGGGMLGTVIIVGIIVASYQPN